jgi:aminomethyltransferase
MNEVTEQSTVNEPLAGESRPHLIEDAAAAYNAVREGGAGVVDFSSRARIEVSGSEAVQFLNGLITNDVKTLEVNGWMRAAFPTVQGRLIAETRVLRLANERYLFDTEAATHESVLKTLGRFTLAGDFHVSDLTNQTAHFSIQGARSPEIIEATLGREASRTKRGRVTEAVWDGQDLHVIRATHTAEDGFDIFVGASNIASLHNAFLAQGALAVGANALEILRIEAGIPRFLVDMDETNVVLEALLDDAVSFTKGCYVGQEIIARIHWRGHVAKKLCGLSFDNRVEAHRGDPVVAPEGKEIGRLTSLAFSPRLKHSIALGYVKYDYLKPGTAVRVSSNEVEFEARVAELPFVRGSWYDDQAAAEAQS